MVWDTGSHPNDYKKFLPGGDWSDPKDFQAIAVYIYQVLHKVQSDGTTGPALRLPNPLRNPTRHDVDFTFAQRLHWTAFLLRHFKSYADGFMCQVAVEARVARIWSVLLLEESFRGWWQSLNVKQKEDCLIRHPYADVTYSSKKYNHPTAEEVGSWKAAIQAQANSLGVAPQVPKSEAQPSPRTDLKRSASEDLGAHAGPSKSLRSVASTGPSTPSPPSNNSTFRAEVGPNGGELSPPQGVGIHIDEAWMEGFMKVSWVRSGEFEEG